MLRAVFLSLCLIFFGSTAIAKTDEIILTVSGKAGLAPVIKLNDVSFAKIPHISMTVMTPWYPTPQKFEGPLLRDVLKLAGINDGNIKLIALNDYAISIPVSDALQYDVILARKLNGKIMSVRDKGPLFLIYPFHQHKELISTQYFRRCSWQLNSIKAE
ncbi:molybdopterin-dependent oxidoreductase [Iodobacter arcticus]|uniref:Molybdopterin-dependent oxidoreductase n=1 Tax=Iodobacter arcticus TaxID=590593 RepID=A0ABW2QYP3_9NEIS